MMAYTSTHLFLSFWCWWVKIKGLGDSVSGEGLLLKDCLLPVPSHWGKGVKEVSRDIFRRASPLWPILSLGTYFLIPSFGSFSTHGFWGHILSVTIFQEESRQLPRWILLNISKRNDTVFCNSLQSFLDNRSRGNTS